MQNQAIILGVSIVAQILIARFVFRAEWRHIRQACAIWWLLSVLAFSIAGMSFDRMMAWAQCFNMLWTVPGVLILAILLSLLTRNQRNQTGAGMAPTSSPNETWRSRSFIEQWSALTPDDKRTVMLIIGGFCLFLFSSHVVATTKHQETVRRQFHLPETASFSKFRYYSAKGSQKWPQVEAVVTFSDDDFKAYMGTLWNPNIWKPVPFQHGKANVAGPFAQDAFSWHRRPPLPRYAGDRLGNFDFVSQQEVYAIKKGWRFCFAIEKPTKQTAESGKNDKPEAQYKVASCYNVARDAPLLGYVAAAIDEETRTLHMIIQ